MKASHILQKIIYKLSLAAALTIQLQSSVNVSLIFKGVAELVAIAYRSHHSKDWECCCRNSIGIKGWIKEIYLTKGTDDLTYSDNKVGKSSVSELYKRVNPFKVGLIFLGKQYSGRISGFTLR